MKFQWYFLSCLARLSQGQNSNKTLPGISFLHCFLKLCFLAKHIIKSPSAIKAIGGTHYLLHKLARNGCTGARQLAKHAAFKTCLLPTKQRDKIQTLLQLKNCFFAAGNFLNSGPNPATRCMEIVPCAHNEPSLSQWGFTQVQGSACAHLIAGSGPNNALVYFLNSVMIRAKIQK